MVMIEKMKRKYIKKTMIICNLIILLCSFIIFPVELSAKTGLGPSVIIGKRDFIWPVPGYYQLQSCFYDNRSLDHCALDFSAPNGSRVVAAYGGVVVATNNRCTHNYSKNTNCCSGGDGFGNYVVIRHNYELKNGQKIELYSRYSHLTSVNVVVNQEVARGTQVGTVGSTGFSQGNHLDFQILKGGWSPYRTYSIDPYANELLELPSDLRVTDSDPSGCGYDYYSKIKAIYSGTGGGSNNPTGCLDIVEASNGSIHVRGWAYDQDALGTALKIHVYVGGPVGSGASGYEIVADKSRPDVNNAFPGVGNNHGFDDWIAVSLTGAQKVYVYALNVGGGTQNPCIGNKTVDIPKAKDTTVPKISDVYVHDVTTTGYKVHCVVHDDGGNLSYVLFPTWTPDNNGQDDLTWDRADISGAGWELNYEVKISSHNNESNCNYRTHIYVYDTEGNVSSIAVEDVYIGTKKAPETTEQVQTPTQTDKENSVVTVSKTALNTIAASKKGFTAYWSRSSNADGYQLQYCTNSLFIGAKKTTINDGMCTSKKVSKLSAKKKYYVRVRAFKNVNGKKKYSSWSKTIYVKTK